ncbi:hypothetical protein VFPBJ_08960 [Purpureocillium lilacinum]|uniref:Uncharacterized protein n=1 Tax=Purpureocillium lilacinum TaxID=33203 RepID=A0A179GGM7_PURLI|nr:hypothetical protein VFPBJ_08960 [Purpureocillium lilacinum]
MDGLGIAARLVCGVDRRASEWRSSWDSRWTSAPRIETTKQQATFRLPVVLQNADAERRWRLGLQRAWGLETHSFGVLDGSSPGGPAT